MSILRMIPNHSKYVLYQYLSIAAHRYPYQFYVMLNLQQAFEIYLQTGVGLKSMQSCRVEELSSAIRQCLDSKEIRQKAAALGHELSKD